MCVLMAKMSTILYWVVQLDSCFTGPQDHLSFPGVDSHKCWPGKGTLWLDLSISDLSVGCQHRYIRRKLFIAAESLMYAHVVWIPGSSCS